MSNIDLFKGYMERKSVWRRYFGVIQCTVCEKEDSI